MNFWTRTLSLVVVLTILPFALYALDEEASAIPALNLKLSIQKALAPYSQDSLDSTSEANKHILNLEVFKSLYESTIAPDLQRYELDKLPDDLRFDVYRANMIFPLYTPFDQFSFKKRLQDALDKYDANPKPYWKWMITINQCTIGVLTVFSTQVDASCSKEYDECFCDDPDDYNEDSDKLLDYICADPIFFESLKSIITQKSFKSFLDTAYPKQKPFFLRFSFAKINKELDEFSKHKTFESMGAELIPIESSCIPVMTLYPGVSSTWRSIPDILLAFEHIFSISSMFSGRSVGLSIDFDDTIVLSEERLYRHFLEIKDKTNLSSVDQAVLNAVTHLSISFHQENSTALMQRLRTLKIKRLMSPQLPALLQRAMDEGITVFINTARPGDEASRTYTVKQLESIINLACQGESQHPLKKLPKGSLTLDPTKFNTVQHPHLPFFDDQNILYTHGWEKGPVLDLYLEQGGVKFDMMFHLDDQYCQTLSMLNTFSGKTIIHSLHYQPRKISLFTDVIDINRYINKHLRHLFQDYPPQDLDWTGAPHPLIP